MNVRSAMDHYFEKLLDVYSKKIPPYPVIPFDEDVRDFIYIGEPDEFEWIGWKPVVKKEKHDLNELSNLLGVKIHPSVDQYYNSYWFCILGGRIGDYAIQL